MWVGPRPRTSGPESQTEARASTGMVRPMPAIAEPSARFSLVCTGSRRAERSAAMVSGSRQQHEQRGPCGGLAAGLEVDDLHELHGCVHRFLHPALVSPTETPPHPKKHREWCSAIRWAPPPVVVLPTFDGVRRRWGPSERLRPSPAPPRPPPASWRPSGW